MVHDPKSKKVLSSSTYDDLTPTRPYSLTETSLQRIKASTETTQTQGPTTYPKDAKPFQMDDLDLIETFWKTRPESKTRALLLSLVIEIRCLRDQNALLRDAGNDLAYALEEGLDEAFRKWRILTVLIPSKRLPLPDFDPDKG